MTATKQQTPPPKTYWMVSRQGMADDPVKLRLLGESAVMVTIHSASGNFNREMEPGDFLMVDPATAKTLLDRHPDQWAEGVEVKDMSVKKG